MHYIIGDVHGCFAELMKLLEKIESQDTNAIIYFVGDLIDRGPDVWKVLEWAMENISEDGKYRSVRGNHEQMVINWFARWQEWKKECFVNGQEQAGKEPKTKYDFYDRLVEQDKLHTKDLEQIIDFFEKRPYHQLVTVTDKEGVERKYRIVHAWYCQDSCLSQEELNHAYIWERTLSGNENSGECIVHGHTPTIPDANREIPEERAGKIIWEKSSNSINIDGGCCYKQSYAQYPCMLCGICLETLEEFYPCSLEERFEEFKREGYLAADSRIEDFPAFKILLKNQYSNDKMRL